MLAVGIRFIAMNERIDLNPKTGAGESFLSHLTMLAKAESKMIVRNVRAGVARAKSLGVHCGRPQRRFSRAQACKLRQEGLSIGEEPDFGCCVFAALHNLVAGYPDY